MPTPYPICLQIPNFYTRQKFLDLNMGLLPYRVSSTPIWELALYSEKYLIQWNISGSGKPLSSSNRRSSGISKLFVLLFFILYTGSVCVRLDAEKSGKVRLDWWKDLHGWRFGWWQFNYLCMPSTYRIKCRTPSWWNRTHLYTISLPGKRHTS